MEDDSEEVTPPDSLPDDLLQRIDSLGFFELKQLSAYVEARKDAVPTPLAEDIEANAAGEVLKVEDHGAYALVRKHPPGPDGAGIDTEVVSLYHVRREQHTDGEESLHWAYLGDVENAEQTRCQSCGGPLDADAKACPHCGTDRTEALDTEDRS